MTTNICRIKSYEVVMSSYICIGFINFMLNNKRLVDFTNLFFLNYFLKNDKLILEYFR